MFFLFLIAVPLIEVFVFVEVGHAIGWLWALALALGTTVIGWQLVRIEGRSAIERFSLAVSQRRAPARVAIDGALGFLGGMLLVVPGFLTDVLGVLLVLPPTRALTRRWVERHYTSRMMRFAAAATRFAPGARAPRTADVESTAIEDDLDELER
jgi:UPF0716 protein FxsA